MSKYDEFITFINDLKKVSSTITEEQRKGLLNQAVTRHGLTVDEAIEILNTSGFRIGETANYFEVLGISVDDLQSKSDSMITSLVDAAHEKLYRASLNAGGRVRPDGKTEEQWRTTLNQARDTLKDRQKRETHIEMIQSSVSLSTENINKTEFNDIEKALNDSEIHPRKSIEKDDMILIPEGEFQMGSDDIDASEDEKPVHTVYVDAFYIDKYPVTNGQYKEFVDANPQWHNLGWHNFHFIIRKYRDSDYLINWFKGKYPEGTANRPVNWVSWYAAMAYAKWVGKRLPTEAEWEKAARGGLVGRKYPWGDLIDVSKVNYDKHIGETNPVGKYTPNEFGLYDIVGNVAEWCLDEWKSDYYASLEHQNPISGGSIQSIIDTISGAKTERVIRGGSWHSSENEVRVSSRAKFAPWKTNSLIGFRCVKDIEK